MENSTLQYPLTVSRSNRMLNFKETNLLPRSFTKEFFLEPSEFTLETNNFPFDFKMFNQTFGRVMGTKRARPYACLTIGYQEKSERFKTFYARVANIYV